MLSSMQYNINNYKYNKPAKISFKGESENETRRLITSLQKGKSMDSDRLYSKVNPNLDIAKIQQFLKRRIRILPLLMDQLMIDTDMYIGKETTCDTFSRSFIDNSAPFYKRIQLGKNKELYSESYKPEISLINTIVRRCIKFRDQILTKAQLDKDLEIALVKYAKASRDGIKHFTI